MFSRRDFLKVVLASLVSAGLSRIRSARGLLRPQSPSSVKRIYIAPDDMTDLMWTADEATYRQAQVEMLDYYLDLADATQELTPDHQSRWNCDGYLWVWNYAQERSAAEFARLMERIRSGHISVPLNASTVTYGATPAEAALRGMYYPGRLERRYNVHFPLAYALENHTLPLGIAALWAGAGARYSWNGICGCATRLSYPWDREHEIYWWTGLDGSRILIKWNSMLANMEGMAGPNRGMGGYAEAFSPDLVVEYVDSNEKFKARYPYEVIGAFGKGWDGLEIKTDEFVIVAREKTGESRRVIVSNEIDFFDDFEATYGAKIPAVTASFGNEWDLYCTSLAEVSARVKRAVERLRSAEAMATLVSLKKPGFMASRETERDLAWLDLGLYWEHCWTADSPVIPRRERANFQRRLAGEIEAYVDKLSADAAPDLGGLIDSAGRRARCFAFNPLSWARSDYADLPYDGAEAVHVFDLSANQETPSQIVAVDGQRRLRFFARDVPPVGYKVFEIRTGTGQAFSRAAVVDSGVLENDFYRVAVSGRGALTSLRDKQRANREFIRAINKREANDLGPGSGTLKVENEGPVTVTLVATAPDPLSHTTRITLARETNRIEIHNEIKENFSEVHTWGFSFELQDADLWHEEVGAVLQARLTGQGGHYAERNARVDWLTLNHFADLSDGDVGITLSNADCYFMRFGNSAVEQLDTSTPQISVLAGGQVDGEAYGISKQGGDTYFLQRFALITHGAFDPSSAMRFALEHQNPLATGWVTGSSGYPEKSYSFLKISNPDVLLWSLKPAEEGIGAGMIARVWNLSTQAAAFSLSCPERAIGTAFHATHIETPLTPAKRTNGALSDTLNPQQMKTYLLKFSTPSFLPMVRR